MPSRSPVAEYPERSASAPNSAYGETALALRYATSEVKNADEQILVLIQI